MGSELPALYQEYLRRTYGAQPAIPLITGRNGGGWERGMDTGGNALVPMPQAAAEAELEAEDQREFSKYQAALGDDAPRSLAEFQDIKYNDPEILELLNLDRSLRSELIDHPEMALPGVETATAPDEKFTCYLFNPEKPDGWAKGTAFTSRLGYSIENWAGLQEEVLRGVLRYTATFKRNNGYGDLYEQHMILYGLKGKPAHVLVGWIVYPNGSVSMTTLYVEEVKL